MYMLHNNRENRQLQNYVQVFNMITIQRND